MAIGRSWKNRAISQNLAMLGQPARRAWAARRTARRAKNRNHAVRQQDIRIVADRLRTVGSVALPELLPAQPLVPVLLSPDVRHGGDILLDDVPDGGGDNQRHQFCAPIFDEKTLNRGFHSHASDSLRLGFAIGLITFEK